MVAMAWNPSAVEFTPCGAPPGLAKLEELRTPPGLPAPPPGLTAPPGLCCPPGLHRISLADHVEEKKDLAAPPGKFSPPGNFSPLSPPGLFAPAGPPGVFVPAGPPGILLAKDLDAISSTDISTDAESDSGESSIDGSFCE